MIPDWKHKKLTFLMIPEANQKVRRFQAPLAWVYAACIGLGAFFTAAAVIVAVQSVTLQTNGALTTNLETELMQHEELIAEKDREIERLREELVDISEQAEAFSAKMEQLRTLERDILAHSADAGISDRAIVSVLSAVEAPAVGGHYEPVESFEDTMSLSEYVRSSFTEMEQEAELLEESLTEALEEAERIAYLRSVTPSIHPTISTRVTSSFGFRRDPFTRRTSRHQGVDFGGDVGDPVFSTAAGSVSRSGYDRAMGNYVFIDHGHGLETVYMHLNKSLVTKGQNVKKGEKIGLLGSTGRSTGPHLHYEVHKNGIPVNPKPYLKETKG